VHQALSAWQNFYVIVGSAAGALTGLQFVVLTLVAQARTSSSMDEIRAFGTPTVVHFCTALLISALMVVPWPSLENFGACLGICGFLGFLYSLSIFRHARRAQYNPDLEDWIWYAILPVIAHLALLTATVLLWWNLEWAFSVVAGDALMFLLLGIHNSWDTVTYIAVNHAKGSTSTDQKD
jgi:hypothetical protein